MGNRRQFPRDGRKGGKNREIPAGIPNKGKRGSGRWLSWGWQDARGGNNPQATCCWCAEEPVPLPDCREALTVVDAINRGRVCGRAGGREKNLLTLALAFPQKNQKYYL